MVAMAENSPAGSKRARSRTSPTGLTPRQASKKTYGSMIRQGKRLPGKKLQFGPVRSVPLTSCSQSWTKAEELGLVRFLITRGYSTAWPTTKRLQFWSDAADYLLKYHGHSVRTSGSCRARVMMKLATKYKSPSVAENQLNATGSDVVESSAVLSDEASTTLPRSSYSPLTIEHLPTFCASYASQLIDRADSSSTTSLERCSVKSPESPAESESSDGNLMMEVLWVGEVYKYTIPSFNVLTVSLRHIRATSTHDCGTEQADVFIRDTSDVNTVVPAFLKILKSCTVECAEFKESVGISNLKTSSDRILVIWEWLWLSCGKTDENSSDAENSSQEDSVNDSPSSETEADQGCLPQRHHTVTFKVIGCTKERQYQSVLSWAQNLIEQGHIVQVQLAPEYNNPYDPNAVAFQCLKDGKFQRIGYVVKEVASEVRDALEQEVIVAVKFKWIKYITDWSRSGPGYFAGVSVTKLDYWSTAVVRAASTR